MWLEGVASRDWAGRREAWNWAVERVPVPAGGEVPTDATSFSGRCELLGAGHLGQSLAVVCSPPPWAVKGGWDTSSPTPDRCTLPWAFSGQGR